MLSHLLVAEGAPFVDSHPLDSRRNDIANIDEQTLIDNSGFLERDAGALLRDFERNRRQSVEWLRTLEHDDFARKAKHELAGEVAVADIVHHIAFHDLLHLRQLSEMLMPALDERRGACEDVLNTRCETGGPQMSLLAELRSAATERALIEAGTVLGADAVFRLVRDMPYLRVRTAFGDDVLSGAGPAQASTTCCARLFEELGVPVVLIVAPHEFTPASAPWLPEPLLEECRSAPLPDVHNFLRAQLEPELDWQTIDATWPLAAGRLGLPTNEALRPGEDHTLAADPIEVHHVPPDVDAQALKQRIVEDVAKGQTQRRDRFIEQLSAWLAEALGEDTAAFSSAANEGQY